LDQLFGDFLNNTHQEESSNVWRLNRMLPVRILRSVFPRPTRLPETGASVERFIILDTPQAAPYVLPDPSDCGNMYVIQGHGSRTILLRPTQECRTVCRTLSVHLPTNYVCK
jgi:hypothetical protein